MLASTGTKEVLIGKDTRISGYMLESAMEAGFSAAGVNVALIGPDANTCGGVFGVDVSRRCRGGDQCLTQSL